MRLGPGETHAIRFNAGEPGTCSYFATIAGADAISGAEQTIVALKEDLESNRPLSTSLGIDN